MSTATEQAAGASRKPSRLPILIGVILMVILGGGAFYAVYSGAVLGHGGDHEADLAGETAVNVEALPEIAFVPMDSIVVSLGSDTGRYLHFSAQIEVAKAHQADVALLLPRVVDVLNGYLRAVEVHELEDPVALVRLRAQMLRRVQMVTGNGRVRDLLITEFVIN